MLSVKFICNEVLTLCHGKWYCVAGYNIKWIKMSNCLFKHNRYDMMYTLIMASMF